MRASAALPSTMFGKLPLYLSLLLLTQCSKCKLDNPTPLPPKDPLSVLPAETQTGAGTLGCLVNGNAYATISSVKCRGTCKVSGHSLSVVVQMPGPYLERRNSPSACC